MFRKSLILIEWFHILSHDHTRQPYWFQSHSHLASTGHMMSAMLVQLFTWRYHFPCKLRHVIKIRETTLYFRLTRHPEHVRFPTHLFQFQLCILWFPLCRHCIVTGKHGFLPWSRCSRLVQLLHNDTNKRNYRSPKEILHFPDHKRY